MAEKDEKDEKDVLKDASNKDSDSSQNSVDYEKRYLLVMPNTKQAVSVDTLDPPAEARKLLAQKTVSTKTSRSHRKFLFWFSIFFVFLFLWLLIAEIVIIFIWLVYEPGAKLSILASLTFSTAFIGWILLWTCVRASTKY